MHRFSLRPHRGSTCLLNSLRAAYALLLAAGTLSVSLPAHGAVPNRLKADASLRELAELPQPVSRRVARSFALGHLQPETPMTTMSLVLAPSAAQSAALEQLLAAQQTPGSPLYHQWLTPEQFGATFGISDSDLQVLESWLTSRGFQVTGVARGRNQISFSGTSAAVESAFNTTMGRFRHSNGQEFFENSTTLQLPAAFSGLVNGVNGLSSYRPRPKGLVARPRPDGNFSNGSHFLSPADVRIIYDANGLVSSGFSGSGVKIAVIGQSEVDLGQIANFQTLVRNPSNVPVVTLAPNTGSSTRYQGDESESEADLEYSSGVAPAATINFVYAGSSNTANVFTAMNYAIANNLAPIISLSYGNCELAESSVSSQEQLFRQANAQGQTIVNSSGDSGAAGCDPDDVASSTDGPQAPYPASSPLVTGVGGTVFLDSSGAYWNSTNGSTGTPLSSAIGYIPEGVWNDSTSALAASGGGPSVLFGKPGWQTGTGVPADGARDTPDISFSASFSNDPYLLCTSDTSVSSTSSSGVTTTGVCSATAFSGYVVGGTSLSTPSFAAMLALVENAHNNTPLGNINPLLYATAAATPNAFHDVTSGNNAVPCTAGTTGCVNGYVGYAATSGYDLATGLGSMDIGAFSAALSANTAAVAKTPNVTVTESSATSTTITFTITVNSASGSTQPTGSVSVTLDSGTATAVPLASAFYGASATYTVTTTGLAAGSHVLRASYAGDANFTSSSDTYSFTTGAAVGSFTITPSATKLTVAAGNTISFNMNLASTGGFTGLVEFFVTNAAANPTGCFTGRQDASLAANQTVAIPLVYHSSSNDTACASGFGAVKVPAGIVPAPGPNSSSPLLAVLAGGALLGGLAAGRRRAWRGTLLMVALAAGAAGVSGCGSGSSLTAADLNGGGGSLASGAKAGTYTVTFVANSYPGGSITSQATMTIVIQ